MKFPKGQSGNPGGRPKVLGEVQELARQHAPSAIVELARLALKGKSETARIAAIHRCMMTSCAPDERGRPYVTTEPEEFPTRPGPPWVRVPLARSRRFRLNLGVENWCEFCPWQAPGDRLKSRSPDVLANAGPSVRAFRKLVNDWRSFPLRTSAWIARREG